MSYGTKLIVIDLVKKITIEENVMNKRQSDIL